MTEIPPPLENSINAIGNPKLVAEMTADQLDALSGRIGEMRNSADPAVNQNLAKLSASINANLNTASDANVKAARERLRNEITRTEPLDRLLNPLTGAAVDRAVLFANENPAAATAIGVGAGVGVLATIVNYARGMGTSVQNFFESTVWSSIASAATYFSFPFLQRFFKSAEQTKKEAEEKEKQDQDAKKNETTGKQGLEKILAEVPDNGTIAFNDPRLLGATADASSNLFALGNRTIELGGQRLRLERVPAETGPLHFVIGTAPNARRFRMEIVSPDLGVDLNLGELATGAQRLTVGGRSLLRLRVDLARHTGTAPGSAVVKRLFESMQKSGPTDMYIEEKQFTEMIANVGNNPNSIQSHPLQYFAEPVFGVDYFVTAPTPTFTVGTPPVGVIPKSINNVRFTVA